MNTRFTFSKKSGVMAALLLALAGCSHKEEAGPTAPPAAAGTAAAVGAGGISGVNWADERDNFVDGYIIPSGLSTADTYASAQATADKVVGGFQTNMGANTIRFGINPPSVLDGWWGTYTGAIDKSLSKGCKVILACWEGSSSKDGRVDDLTRFWSMWQTVVAKYGGNANVYFEVFNEPHGYSGTDLKTLYADWLGRYPGVPKGRVLLDGTGYAQNVVPIGDDSRFTDCLLSVHLYTFFVSRDPAVLPKTAAEWERLLASKVGSYAGRSVLTEFGTNMTSGNNYTAAINNVPEAAYLQGVTNQCRRAGIASVYWPGLRTNDVYSIQQYNGTSMTTTNASGLSRIKYGWNVGSGGTSTFYPTAYYRIINHHSGQVMDIPAGNTTPGTRVKQYLENGGENQQWQILDNGTGYYRILNRQTGLALDVPSSSTADGAEIAQYAYNGGANQQWQLVDAGGGYYRIVNRNSGKVADVPGSSTTEGTIIKQYPSNGGDNQEWLIIQQ